jgi:hypothetical protein
MKLNGTLKLLLYDVNLIEQNINAMKRNKKSSLKAATHAPVDLSGSPEQARLRSSTAACGC